MNSYRSQLVQAIPKTDLHVHLDGSLRIGTLIELAKNRKVALPSETEAGLRETVFKDRYADLEEYLRGFAYTCGVLRDPEALEQVAYELAWDNFNEGVRYIEPRFAPQLHANEHMDILEVLAAANRGLERAKKEINAKKEIAAGEEPPFDYAIIGCAMRKFTAVFSPYFQKFLDCHRFTKATAVYPLASLELVSALVRARDDLGLPVTGFDLAGEERGWPANVHRKAYAYAQRHFLKKTVHAGEAYGPPSIFQAITQCHANRIGHGTHLFASDLVELSSPAERQRYTDALAENISSRRITIEVCLTSNQQTIPTITDLTQHPVGEMIARRMSVTLCTDNRLVSNTTVCREYEKFLEAFPVSDRELKNIVIYGFKRSFSSMPYPKKRAYVHQVIEFYEKVEKQFLQKEDHEPAANS